MTADWLRHRFGADATWLPFDLHPEYPPEGIPREQLHARYGSGFHDRLERMFEQAGLAYKPPPDVVPNTRRALRVTELARERGLHGAVHDRLMDAYWADEQNIGDPAVLLALVVEVGLDAVEVEDVLDSERYGDLVAASTAQAHSIGVNGIPAFLLDRRLLVLGVQPREVFEQAFARLEAPD